MYSADKMCMPLYSPVQVSHSDTLADYIEFTGFLGLWPRSGQPIFACVCDDQIAVRATGRVYIAWEPAAGYAVGEL